MEVSFNKSGYDPFIDFLKTYCILVVVFCHGFPYLKEIGYPIWGGQIPLFFIIQVFHCYKREPKSINWSLIVKRILLPFLVIEILIFVVLFLTEEYESLSKLIKVGVSGGGYGPGSYYPWVYIQMAILIPLMRPLCEKLNKGKSLLLFLLISETIEIICSLIDMPDALYRLLCLRYIMLIWFGWLWVKEGIQLNLKTILISLLSLGSIIYLGYLKWSLEPWLYDTGWTTHRWPCYFWVGILFVWILYKIFVAVSKYGVVRNTIKILASASYEIFLVQMAYYALFHAKYITFVDNEYLKYGLWLVLAFFVSLIGGIALYKFDNKFVVYKK